MRPLREAQPAGRRVKSGPDKAKSTETGDRTVPRPEPVDLHDPDRLRTAAAELLDTGEVRKTADGPIRISRIAQAQKNSASGAYNRHDVLSTIVDRLLDQWNL